jgi:spatacsin
MDELSYHVIRMIFQGPVGWHSLSSLPIGESLLDRDTDFFINDDENAEISAISWEATIQKHIEEELYDSSLGVCASSFSLGS